MKWLGSHDLILAKQKEEEKREQKAKEAMKEIIPKILARTIAIIDAKGFRVLTQQEKRNYIV